MRNACAVLLVGFLLALTGCAGLGVISMPDPAARLRDAAYLINEARRPVPAERLIRSAVQTYEERNDSVGLADAYRMYAYFLTSEAVASWGHVYREKGFMSGTRFDERFTKAIEYLDRAEELVGDTDHFDLLTNIHFLKSQAFHALKDRDGACSSLDRSVAANLENIRRNPDAKVQSPGFASFADAVALNKTRMGCMRANESLRTIAILEPDEPTEYRYVHFYAQQSSIARAMMERMSKDLSKSLIARNPSLARLMSESLTTELRSEGYTVVSLRASREKPGRLIEDYSRISTDADAVLDMALLPPWFVTDGNSDLEPSLPIALRLVSSRTKEVLYMRFFNYGYAFRRAGNFDHIPFAKRTSFKNIGALSNAPDTAIAALREGVPMIAAQVRRDLQK